MRRIKIMATIAAILLNGCAALLNSNRPRYSGPVIRPSWHNSSVKAEQRPLIYDGVVYAIARPFNADDRPRVFAFDLSSGNALWNSTFPVKTILVGAGPTLFVADDAGQVH